MKEHRRWGIALTATIAAAALFLFWAVPVFRARWPLSKPDVFTNSLGQFDTELLLAMLGTFGLAGLIGLCLVMFLLSGLPPATEEPP